MIRTFFFLFIVVLFPFRQKPVSYERTGQFEKLILGEWMLVKQPPVNDKDGLPPPPVLNEYMEGYSFFPDGSCERKSGFWKTEQGTDRWDRITIFLGTKTTYKLEDNNLNIYDPGNNSWKSMKIFSITNDTLIFQHSNNLLSTYAKLHPAIDSTSLFDAIIVSSSGCFGTCPVNNIYLTKKGDVYYYGFSHNTFNGFFQSKVSSELVAKIESDFKKADVINLNDSYAAGYTDDETITVTFVKNKRIIKSISDYGRTSPAQFYWAYTPVRYLYQHIPLDTLEVPEYINAETFFFKIKNKNKTLNLYPSESFYLWNLLLQSQEVQKKSTFDYVITFKDKKLFKEIKTDGRFYELELTNNRQQTLDIGYNFLTENNMTKRFQK